MIRVMKMEDYDQVYALWSRIHGFGLRSVDDSREGIRRFLERNPTTSVVAEEDGRIVAAMEALKAEKINKVSLIAFTRNDIGNAFWKEIGWTKRQDLNYYDFTLNEANITAFIQ